MNFDQVILEKEQKQLFVQILEGIKDVRREEHVIINSKTSTGDWVTAGSYKNHTEIDNIADGDLHELVRKGLLKRTSMSSDSENYSITPEGFNYYEWLIQNDNKTIVQKEHLKPIEYELGDVNSKIQNLISRIDQLRKELDRLSPMKEEYKKKLIKKVYLDWTYHSCKLEGNELTYGETRELLQHNRGAEKSYPDQREIKGHEEAIFYIEDTIQNNRPITEAFIRELNLKVLKEPYPIKAETPDGNPTSKTVDPGKYKTTPNHVKTKTGDRFEYAEPRDVPILMQELLNWFEKSTIHPFLKSVELHYRFIRIHPFDDGNGRVSRLLLNYCLLREGFSPIIIDSDTRDQYLSSLRKADVEEFESLHVFLGNALIHSLELYISAAKGEDINEYKDIDRRLAVLREKSKQDGKDKITQIRSKNLITIRFEDSIWPFFNSLLENTKKFYLDFTKYEVQYMIDRTTFSGEFSSSDIQLKFKEAITEVEYLRELGIEIRLLGYIQVPENPLSKHLKTTVEFQDYHYIINPQHLVGNSGLPEIKKLYDKSLTKEEIEDYVRKDGLSIVEHLESYYESYNSKEKI